MNMNPLQMGMCFIHAAIRPSSMFCITDMTPRRAPAYYQLVDILGGMNWLRAYRFVTRGKNTQIIGINYSTHTKYYTRVDDFKHCKLLHGALPYGFTAALSLHLIKYAIDQPNQLEIRI